MNVLAIDTSSARGSVALLVGGELQMAEFFTADRTHTTTLFPMLERALQLAAKIDVIVIGLGPGSFAGVRIAIATAIGLELGLNARLVGMPSAAALETEAPMYVAIGDARREMFYFTEVAAGCCLRGPLLASAEELEALLALHPALPLLATEPLSAFPQAALALPVSEKLARLAAADRGITARDHLEPIYLREPHITYPKAPAPRG